MNSKQLRYFVAVASEGAFIKAAAKLRVAQPALSRQIGLLEGELGAPLLTRHRRGVAVTDAGAALLERARPLLLAMDRIQSEITNESAAPSGALRIGCTPTLTGRLLVKPIRRILASFPDVAVQIQEGVSHQLCRAVLADELDAAIVSENLAESFLAAEALFDEEVWLFGPRGARGRAVTLRRLAALPLIMARAPQTTRRLIERAAGAAGLRLNVIAESDSVPATRALIRGGVGHTVAPYSALIDDVKRGAMSGAPIRGHTIRRSLVRRNDRPVSRALHEFRTLLADEVRQLARSLPGVTVCRSP